MGLNIIILTIIILDIIGTGKKTTAIGMNNIYLKYQKI